MNELACKWYENNLLSQSGGRGYQYLQKRGISRETAKEFRIGFAISSFDGLLNFLRQKNFTLNVLEKSGVIVSKAGGGYRDLFRNRLMFPIADIRDRIIGFGGRVLDNSLPKYINSPETSVYVKGRNLYGLNKAKEHIRGKDALIIVEGYLDLITLKQAGIGWVASSSGTALTEEQARLIKRFTQNVIMIFDSDKAGEMATLRTLDIFIREDMNVKVVVLPGGSDPDSFLRDQGKDKFISVLNSAQDLFSYKLKVLKSMFDVGEIYGKAKVIHEMLASINCFRNAVIRSEYLKRLTQELGTDEEALKIELKKISTPRTKIKMPDKAKPDAPASKYVAAERLLIKVLLENPECISILKERIAPSDFQDRRFATLIKTLFDFSKQGELAHPHRLINHFLDSDIAALISELMSNAEPIPQEKDKILDDCIKRIKQSNYRMQLNQLHEQIQLTKDNPEKLNRLVEEYNSLMKSGSGTN